MKIKDEALKFLSLQPKNETFFLGVGFHKPHVPFHIPRDYLDQHDDLAKFVALNDNYTEKLPDIAWNPWMDLKKRQDIAGLDIEFPYGQMPADFAKYVRHHYYAGAVIVITIRNRPI